MPRNLLLADDSITIQKVVGITFAGEDFSIVAVDNGDDAIRKAKESPPDIILADVVMPKKNGYEVCEAVKNDPGLAHVPVLLLAGTFEAFDEARARAVHADGHIAKPFESQALVNKVRELLERQKAAAEPSRDASKPPLAAPPPPKASPLPPRSIVPPVLARPAAPFGAPAAPTALMPDEGSPARPTPDRNPAGELDWAALGLETDAAVRPPDAPGAPPRSAVAARTLPPAPPAAGPMPLRPATPASPGAGQAAASPAVEVPDVSAWTAQPTTTSAPAPTPTLTSTSPSSTPELLPFGEPIDLADLEVQEVEPEPDVLPEPTVGDTQQRAGSRTSAAAASGDGGEALLRQALSEASREVIERIAWEVIPTLAETIIREQVERLVKAREK